MFNPILYLVLGWLFGLLAPAIHERIRRNYRANELIAAIFGELHELQYQMAWMGYLLRSQIADMSDEWLDWFLPILQNYRGPEPKPPSAMKAVEGMRAAAAEVRRQTLARLRPPSITLKEFSAPLLTAHLPDVSIFPVPVQAAILRIKSKLDTFNQNIRFLQDQFDKTFTVTGSNLEAFKMNLHNGYSALADMTKQIADAISAIRPEARPVNLWDKLTKLGF